MVQAMSILSNYLFQNLVNELKNKSISAEWNGFSSWIHFMIDQDPKSLEFYASEFLKGCFMQKVKM